MKKNILNDEIANIQVEYARILQSFDANKIDNFNNAIDEINLFWYSNRITVDLYLKNISQSYDCYAHTAGGMLDTTDYEHYPFILLGKKHIIDDPLSRFSLNISNLPDIQYKKRIISAINNAVSDNIDILKHYNKAITILPITTIYEKDFRSIGEISEKTFIDMFKDSTMAIADYDNNFLSIDDVQAGLLDHIPDQILFSDDCSPNENFRLRFKRFVESVHNPFGKGAPDAVVFKTALIGFIIQAITVISIYREFKIVPYVRNFMSSYYINLFAPNFYSDEIIQNILIRSRIAFIAYNNFNFELAKSINFFEYTEKVKQFNVVEDIIIELKGLAGSPLQVPLLTLKDIVLPKLEKFWEAFATS